jgi:hypothetical protein
MPRRIFLSTVCAQLMAMAVLMYLVSQVAHADTLNQGQMFLPDGALQVAVEVTDHVKTASIIVIDDSTINRVRLELTKEDLHKLAVIINKAEGALK